MNVHAKAAADPAEGFSLRIRAGERIVSAGDGFARALSRRLREAGLNYLVTEPAHPIVSQRVAEACQYGVYSARWGDIHTPRQLLQLLRRAYGRWRPADAVWRSRERFYDPFRPLIQPEGFATLREFELDQSQHLAAVRAAFEQMDVFVLTLGRTDAWTLRQDEAAYPLRPGLVAGTLDERRHVLTSFGPDEVVADMSAFLDELGAVNPKARTILTLSPLAAPEAAAGRPVLAASIHAKAILRLAAETLARRAEVHYFPAFEILTGPAAGLARLAEDLSEVTAAGMDAVLDAFLRHAVEDEKALAPAASGDEDIRKTLQQLLIDILDDDEVRLAEGTRQDEVAGWDSVSHMKLLFAVEAELGLRFGTGEHGLPETVDEMVAMIQRKLRA